MRSDQPRWRDAAQASLLPIPEHLHAWLLDQASLTRHLRGLCGDGFRVQLDSLIWSRPSASECRALSLRNGARALIREVHLLCGDTPLVFARTVIPATTLSGYRRRLRHLGNRPLGAFLFADPRLSREAMQLACLLPGQEGFSSATHCLKTKPKMIWGRRSRFCLSGKPLLVQEVFLPKIPGFPSHVANVITPDGQGA